MFNACPVASCRLQVIASGWWQVPCGKLYLQQLQRLVNGKFQHTHLCSFCGEQIEISSLLHKCLSGLPREIKRERERERAKSKANVCVCAQFPGPLYAAVHTFYSRDSARWNRKLTFTLKLCGNGSGMWSSLESAIADRRPFDHSPMFAQENLQKRQLW